MKYCYPVKLMVTYDSLYQIVNYLGNSVNNYIFIVDEFQSIFLDSFFKSNIELDFVNVLQQCSNVVYLSATPMLDKYLNKLEYFKDLHFYRLDWTNSGFVEKILLQRKNVRSLGKACDQIIDNYLSDNYPTQYVNDKIIKSKEAVFYFNSVSEIIRIINRHKELSPQNVLIICAQTDQNIKRLKRIGFNIGSIPLKGEANPMFTFCTSTSYMGVDFYSDCASTYIFADPNIKSLALDVSLDLPQIVGRQRNRSNPFKNNIIIYYKTTRVKISKEAFLLEQQHRREKTQLLLEGYNKMDTAVQDVYLGKLRDSITVSQYSNDFVSISEINNCPVYNPLIEIANERAFEVSQDDYQNSINITKALQDNGFILDDYSDFYELFKSSNKFNEKLKIYCDYVDLHPGCELKIEDPSYKKFYDYYGSSGCASHRYLQSSLEQGLLQADQLTQLIKKHFHVGMCLNRSSIKSLLQSIYDSLGIKHKAKATDLSAYFTLSRTKSGELRLS